MKIWTFLYFCLVTTDVCLSEPNPKDTRKQEPADATPEAVATGNTGNTPELIAVGSDITEDDVETPGEQPERLICYLNFEIKQDVIKKGKIHIINDKSGYDNDGELSKGAEILRYHDKDFTCDDAARIWDGDVLFRGDIFQAKPKYAITIAAMVKLEEMHGRHSIFGTMGAAHNQGQYHFEVNDGILRWFHRNECGHTVFETHARSIPKDEWTHVAGTYDSKTTQAKAYINGFLTNMSIGYGELLSTDWALVSMGNYLRHRPLRGSIDEFRIYNYALKPDEIKALAGACSSPAVKKRSGIAEMDKSGVGTEDTQKVNDRRKRNIKKKDRIKKKNYATKRHCVKKRSMHLTFKADV